MNPAAGHRDGVGPAVGPLFGLTVVTVGARCRCSHRSGGSPAEVPLGVVTVTFTVPVPTAR